MITMGGILIGFCLAIGVFLAWAARRQQQKKRTRHLARTLLDLEARGVNGAAVTHILGTHPGLVRQTAEYRQAARSATAVAAARAIVTLEARGLRDKNVPKKLGVRGPPLARLANSPQYRLMKRPQMPARALSPPNPSVQAGFRPYKDNGRKTALLGKAAFVVVGAMAAAIIGVVLIEAWFKGASTATVSVSSPQLDGDGTAGMDVMPHPVKTIIFSNHK